MDFLQIFSIKFLKRKFVQFHLWCQGFHNLYSQQEANRLYEPLGIKFGEKYADMLHLLLYSGTFIGIIPFGAFFTLLGLLLRACVNKVFYENY